MRSRQLSSCLAVEEDGPAGICSPELRESKVVRVSQGGRGRNCSTGGLFLSQCGYINKQQMLWQEKQRALV